jgi:hypothetical protein
MHFLRTAALSLWCASSVLSKPLINVPAVVPRQDGEPLTADQKTCGDIIVYTRNSESNE